MATEPVFDADARQRIGESVRASEAVRHDLFSPHGQHRTVIPIPPVIEVYNTTPVVIGQTGDGNPQVDYVSWVPETFGLPGNPTDGQIDSAFDLVALTIATAPGLHLIKNVSGRNLVLEFSWNVAMHRTDVGSGKDKVHVHLELFDPDQNSDGLVAGQGGEISTSSVGIDLTKGNACSGSRLAYLLRIDHGFAIRLELLNEVQDNLRSTYETSDDNLSGFSVGERLSYPPPTFMSGF